jgi:tRNA threonylcarbamoyladenosine biosynthesis protein TsaE
MVLVCGKVVTSDSAEATEEIGEALAAELRPGDVVMLRGGLAAGKTTLVRGLTRGLGGDPDEVSSPSFVLIQTYPCGRFGVRELHHVDLYRLADEPEPLREIGLEEVLSDPHAVVAIEWPREAVAGQLPRVARCWTVSIEIRDLERREVTVKQPKP